MDNFRQRLRRTMQRGRSASLPSDNEAAVSILIPYVLQNQVRTVSELLSNPSFDVKYVFGPTNQTLVHLATNAGAADCLALLVRKGFHVNVVDRLGTSPLHIAAKNGYKKCFQKLIEAGADISIRNNEGFTALHWLASNGRTELLVSVLQKGLSVDVANIHGHTALHLACQNGHYQCVVKLLEFGAEVNLCSKNGGNALYFACRHGQVNCVRLLLDRGVQVVNDNDGLSVLEICAEGSYYECVELILTKFPEQVDNELLSLVFSEHIEEEKMQDLLEHLCTASDYFLATILSKLAAKTADAGRELLSDCASGSYQDLMPQFVRAIRILCALYKHYVAVCKSHPSDSLISISVPNNPGEDLEDGAVVRRAGSFGSLLDSLKPKLVEKTRRRSCHQRTHSGGGHSNTPGLREFQSHIISAPSKPDSPSGSYMFLLDPFEQLEMVWCSLESWFDLLKAELDRVVSSEATDTEAVIEGPAGSQDIVNDTHSAGTQLDVRDLGTPSSQNSELAAAIVQSAPSHRRAAFLKPSRSFDHGKRYSTCTMLDSKKRPSWQADTVTARSMSAFSPTDISTDCNRATGTIMEQVLSPELPEEEVKSKPSAEDNSTLVEKYADRLCAVTHAFALCCKIKQINNNCSEPLPRFSKFIDKHEDVIKVLLARNPQLIFAHFHFLLEHTKLMQKFIHIIYAQPFDNRKNWFYENLHSDQKPSDELNLVPNNLIQVERENIFTSSCQRISDVPVHALKEELNVQFIGEGGMGTGVKREWFDHLSQEVLNPDYALFTQSADGATFQPNTDSGVNPDHLSYFKFAGRLMGLALYHRQLLNVYFTRSFYKHILDIPLSYRDVESIDPAYAQGLQWILDNEIDSQDLGLTFSVETDMFGATEQLELKPGGSAITVTDENKREYVQLATDLKMTKAIANQIRSFLDGFYEVVPLELISLFDEYELELLISGLPDIDVADWEFNTEYSSGYSTDSPVVQWFWEIVKSYNKKDLAILLQFATGSSRVPLGGFANLVGATGLTRFTITRMDYHHKRLPMASTCFNLLKLPEYPTKQQLKERLSFALTCGSGIIDIT